MHSRLPISSGDCHWHEPLKKSDEREKALNGAKPRGKQNLFKDLGIKKVSLKVSLKASQSGILRLWGS